ncbi:MAG: methyltransferase [Pseudorhodoplanes sp.]|uniref:methyltransferase n=1 Tax=Pseudorhodoplanes sp. TaxID=1934341 RepID=UPI003D1350C9
MRAACLTLWLMIVAAPPALAQDATRYLAPPGAPADAFPNPGRPVADIISPIFDTEANRDAAKETEQVFALMKLKPGMSVADIGAGSGYYVMRLSKLLGPGGKVFATDITPNYLSALNARILKAKLANVVIARGEPHDPRLPPNSIDAALLIHMYHEIAQPFAFLHNLGAAMKPGGLVGILDPDRPTQFHGTPPGLMRCELAALGYREVSFTALSGRLGNLGVFEAPGAEVRTRPADVKACAR